MVGSGMGTKRLVVGRIPNPDVRPKEAIQSNSCVTPATLSFADETTRMHSAWREHYPGDLRLISFPPTDPGPLSRTPVSLFDLYRTWPRV